MLEFLDFTWKLQQGLAPCEAAPSWLSPEGGACGEAPIRGEVERDEERTGGYQGGGTARVEGPGQREEQRGPKGETEKDIVVPLRKRIGGGRKIFRKPAMQRAECPGA